MDWIWHISPKSFAAVHIFLYQPQHSRGWIVCWGLLSLVSQYSQPLTKGSVNVGVADCWEWWILHSADVGGRVVIWSSEDGECLDLDNTSFKVWGSLHKSLNCPNPHLMASSNSSIASSRVCPLAMFGSDFKPAALWFWQQSGRWSNLCFWQFQVFTSS